MGFLDSVVIPGSTASKAAPNIKQSSSPSGGGFLASVTRPNVQQSKIATLTKQAADAKRVSDEANSVVGLAKQTGKNIFNMGKGLVQGLVEPFINPSELTQSLEQDIPGVLKPIEVPVLRAIMPVLEPFITDATAAIVFNSKTLNDKFMQEAAKGSFSVDTPQGRAGQSLIAATEKTPLQIVGDTAQAVLGAYTPRIVGSGTKAFASKPTLNAITQTVKEGAAYGFTFGTAQVASSGTTDPAEIAEILAHATVGGAVFNLAVAGTIHGVFKSLPHAISELRSASPAQKAGFVEEIAAASATRKLNVEHLPSDYSAGGLYEPYIPASRLPDIEFGPRAPRGDLPTIDIDTGRTTRPTGRAEAPTGTSIIETAPPATARARVVTPVGTGETRISKLAASVDAKAIEEGLTKSLGDLPEYKTMNIAEQAALAKQLIDENPLLALQVALGERLPPRGLQPEAVFVAIEKAAIQSGDVNMLRALASGNLSTQATAMGQRIRLLGERDPSSPVTIIRQIEETRREGLETRTGVSYEKAKTATIKEVKNEIKKAAPTKETWEGFIKSLECGY